MAWDDRDEAAKARDAEWLRRLQTGEDAVLRELMREYGPAIYGYCVLRVRRHDEAEAIWNKVWEHFVRAVRRPNRQYAHPMPLLYRIADRRCCDSLDRQSLERAKYRRLLESQGVDSQWANSFGHAWNQLDAGQALIATDEAIRRGQSVQQALQELGDRRPKWRQILTMRVVDGRTFSEIANSVGLTNKNCRQIYGRGCNWLRTRLEHLAAAERGNSGNQPATPLQPAHSEDLA